MSTSQNGWPTIASEGTRLWVVPVGSGPARTYRLHPGHAGFVLMWVILRFHEKVEKINEGIWDEWGWAPRPIRGSVTVISNHASATAADVNSTKHPLGVWNTFKIAKQKAGIASILAFCGGVVRSGTQYHNRPDDMHWEINVTPESGRVLKLASRLANTPRGKRILAANPGYRPAHDYTPGERPLVVGNSGGDVAFVQRKVGAHMDGEYGPKTAEKVQAWKRAQRAKFPSLVMDGHVGNTTWQALGVKVKYK